MRYQYPWAQLAKGEGFFIPCLDTAEVKREALLAALRLRLFDAVVVEGIFDGVIGVWSYRKPASPARQNESSSDAPDPAPDAFAPQTY